jgi:hypothetical protein
MAKKVFEKRVFKITEFEDETSDAGSARFQDSVVGDSKSGRISHF